MSAKWLRYSPVFVLCVVATWQMTRAHRTELTPWKGGGFGMFSTVDDPNARYVKIFFMRGDERIPVRLPEDKSVWLLRVKADPSSENLDALADFLIGHGVDRLWVYTDQPPLTLPDYCDIADHRGVSLIPAVPADRLHVELWRLSYHADELTLTGERFLAATRPLTDGRGAP